MHTHIQAKNRFAAHEKWVPLPKIGVEHDKEAQDDEEDGQISRENPDDRTLFCSRRHALDSGMYVYMYVLVCVCMILCIYVSHKGGQISQENPDDRTLFCSRRHAIDSGMYVCMYVYTYALNSSSTILYIGGFQGHWSCGIHTYMHTCIHTYIHT